MDKQALQSWFNAVTKVRSDIHAWTLRQSKHANYGWPLVTLLTCLLDDTGFLQNIDGLLDALHRQLKVLSGPCAAADCCVARGCLSTPGALSR